MDRKRTGNGEGIIYESQKMMGRVRMKKSLVTVVATLFLLVTMATANATVYTASITDGTADFTFSGFDIGDTGPLILTLYNASGTVSTPQGIPPLGMYDWSINLTSFGVDLTGDGSSDFPVGPLGPIDIGTYAFPDPSIPGVALLGNVIIPFSIFGLGGNDFLALNQLMVTWDEFDAVSPDEDGIQFTISALPADMENLKGYLQDLDELARQFPNNSTNGISSGSIAFEGSLTASSVPEPSTMILLGLGIVGLAGVSRKKFMK
jgi:hypothetical protein